MFRIPTTARRAIAAALLSAGLVAAVPARAEKVLRFVPQADLKSLDPIGTVNYNTRNFGYLVYDTLFGLDAALTPRPQMVESWTVSDDKLRYAFKLRDGLLWHDGKPVTALDCVVSLRRWAARDSLGGLMMRAVATLEATDERSFSVTLKEPFGQLLEALAKPSSTPAFMMPERLARTDPLQNNTEVIGSGPFKFVPAEWAPGVKVVVVRNEAYRPRAEPASFAAGGKVVKVDRVEWVSIPDAATAAAALQKGEVDWYELPPTDLLDLLRKSKDVTVANVDPLGSQGVLRLNHLQPPFNSREARQAVLALVNQADYMAAAAGDPENWQVCYSVFPCGTPMSSEAGTEALKAKRDPAMAQALLAAGGYRGGKVAIISAGDVAVMQNMALVTADLLRKAGVNVDLLTSDQGAFFARRNSREPVERGGWSIFQTWFNATDLVSPIGSLPLQANGAKGYAGWPDVPRIEELRQAWVRATDPAEQKRIAAEIQRIALDEVLYVPLGQFKLPTAYRRNLDGIIPAPIFFFWNVDKR